MDFLYFLQGLRTPWLDAVMSALTNLGEEKIDDLSVVDGKITLDVPAKKIVTIELI